MSQTLYVEIKPGESIQTTGPARVTLVEKSGQRARFRVIADGKTSVGKLESQSDQPPEPTTGK